MDRLQKVVARAGIASRRGAERLIREGRVTVNGTVVQRLGYRADPTRDKIRVDGRLVLPPGKHLYYAFCKPAALITSMRDPQGRPSLGDRLESMKKGERIFPVGRLDYNSSGLLLLTNHGELAYRLSHPRYKVKRVYRVKVSGLPSEKELGQLRRGVKLKGRVATADRVRVLRRLRKKSWIEIEIHEGRFREVRRMMEALGYSVDKLIRSRFGPVELGTLSAGEIRPLTGKEITALQEAVGMKAEDFTGASRERRALRGIGGRPRPIH